jgi:hypothetical protein
MDISSGINVSVGVTALLSEICVDKSSNFGPEEFLRVSLILQ